MLDASFSNNSHKNIKAFPIVAEIIGTGDVISSVKPKTKSNVIIGEKIRFARGDIIDISPKKIQEKAHTENIAARVIAIEERMLIIILIASGFFLILNFIADMESDITIIPSVARKDSHKPMSNNACGDIASIKTSATKRDVILSASLFIKYEIYTMQSIITALDAEEENPVIAR